MSNIKTINLADHINSAIDKINENFVEVMANAGLTEAEVIALILSEIGKINDDTGFTEAEIRAFLASTTLDLGGNKILFGNMYPSVSELPDASAYHGMFAHVHNTGAAYFAHDGQWVELANKGDLGSGGATSLDELSDVDTTGKQVGQVLRWTGTEWDAATVSGGGDDPTGVYRQTITVFTRHPKTVTNGARVPPAEPSGGSYVFTTGSFSEPSGWSVSQPTSPETQELWSSTYTFVAVDPEDGESFTVPAGGWSSPALVGGPPVDGVVGARTVQLFAYKRVATSTNLSSADKPAGGSFNFATNEYLAPESEGWFAAVPSRTDEAPKLYVSTGIASESGLPNGSTLDDDITWSDPQLTTSGSDGRNGRSTFNAVLYRRVEDTTDSNGDLVVPKPPLGGGIDFSATTPADSYVGHSTTATPAYGPITDPDYSIKDEDGNEWYFQRPSGDDTLWSSERLFSLSGDEGTDWATDTGNHDGVKESWSTPTVSVLIPVSTYFKSLYARIPDVDSLNANWKQIPDPNGIPAVNNGAVYSFTTNRFTTTPALTHEGVAWYEEIPPLLDSQGNSNGPLYETSTVATLRGAIGVDNTLTFTEPKLILNVPIDGIDGYEVTQLTAYRRESDDWEEADSVSGGSFNFSTKQFAAPTGWSKTVPTGDTQLYALVGVASTRPDGYLANDPSTHAPEMTDNSIEWDLPQATQSGGNGAPGRSTALIVAVTRTMNGEKPGDPTGGSVTFTGALSKTMPTGSAQSGTNIVHDWYDDVGAMDTAGYNTGGKIWASEALFTVDGPTGTDDTASWSAPYEDHNNGEDGFSTYRIQLFKRLDKDFGSSNAEDDLRTGLGISSGLTTTGTADPSPSGVYYSFDDDKVYGVGNDWSEEPAATGANALWMTHALASTQGDLQGNDYVLTWSSPVIHSRDGDPGNPDLSNLPKESRGYIYFTTPVVGATWPTGDSNYPDPSLHGSATFNFDTGALGSLPTGWNQNPIVDTNLGGDFWSARYYAQKAEGANGATTVTFSEPFKSYNFNGVVTFQNSVGTLSQMDSDGTQITVIDGGYIRTGKIAADRIDTTGLNITPDWNDLDAEATGTNAGEKVEITSSGMKVYSGNDQGQSVLRVQLGDLSDLPS